MTSGAIAPPSPDGRVLGAAPLAGAAAHLAWEVRTRVVTPVPVGGPPQPASGRRHWGPAEAARLVVGLVVYPLGDLLIGRPLTCAAAPGLSWRVVGAGFGVGLRAVALDAMARPIGGPPSLRGFIPLARASLVGHMLFGVIRAAVLRARGV